MPAPINNDYNKKWKSAAERKAACDAICQHLSKGLSKSSFPLADWETVAKYIKNYPEDFDAEKIAAAEREGRLFWESLGISGAMGQVSGFNAASWIFNMKNRYSAEWSDRVRNEQQYLDANGNPTNPPTPSIEIVRDADKAD